MLHWMRWDVKGMENNREERLLTSNDIIFENKNETM